MNWLGRVFHRRLVEDRLDKELRFHLDHHTADLIARGYAPDEARRMARMSLGGPDQVKEGCRDARGTRWLDDIVQDFRYTLRTLRHKPGFTGVALLTLGLGIGATTVMFTLVHSVLLKPLPFADPDRLVDLMERTTWSTQSGNLWALTYPNYADCRREARSLQIEGFSVGTGGIVSSPGAAEFAEGLEISAGLFPMLGITMVRGRAFRPEEDQAGASPVAIISSDLWQRRFGGNPSAVGQTMQYRGEVYSVVGIAPPGFRLLDFQADVFTPLGQDRAPIMHNRQAHSMVVIARLRSGKNLSTANSELAIIGRQLETAYPKSNQGRTFFAEPLRPNGRDAEAPLWILLGAVTLVLLVGCGNVASLLLARALSRTQEMAMRAALGAGRARLLRQSLTESTVLGLLGGALGVLLAVTGIRPFLAFWPGDLPRAGEIRVDGPVLLFALAVSLASSILFGLAPAIRARASALDATLRSGSRTITGNSRHLQSLFVAAEIALSLVLLISAGMLGRTLLRLSSLDPGVDVKNVLIGRVALSPDTLSNPERARAAWQALLDRVRRVPGVRAVTMVDTVPMRPGSNPIAYATSASVPLDNQAPIVLANSATPDYLQVMRIPLRRGRFFTDQDRIDTQPVAVIDEVMAQQAFPGQDPIGKQVWIGISRTRDPQAFTVIGIVGHVRQWGLAGDDKSRLRAQFYYPFAQVPDPLVRRWSELMSIAVRTDHESQRALEPVQHEIRGAANDQVLYQIRTLEELAGNSLAVQRFLLVLFGILSALTLFLASIGIYGVLAYLANQRIPEIGLRIALGASPYRVIGLILRQSFLMVGAGIVLGVAGAIGAGRILFRLVEGMQPPELSTFAIMTATFLAAALVASLLPARRASRVDPIQALREN